MVVASLGLVGPGGSVGEEPATQGGPELEEPSGNIVTSHTACTCKLCCKEK